jgi:hypothetical protein
MSESYLILIIEPEWDFEAATDEDWAQASREHAAFSQAVKDSGNEVLDGDALAGIAQAVRIRPAKDAGEPLVTEGPFAEGAEFVSGYYKITARDLAQAKELASMCPTGGYIELHPIADLTGLL